ncbi:MAG: hypothetical protein QXS85_04270 [Acidilobaceae archaeon]
MDLSDDLDSGDEFEPTLGASRICLKDSGILPEELASEVEAEVYVRDATHVDLLLYHSSDTELVAEAASTPDCLVLLSLKLRRCGASARSLLEWVEWPEVSRAVVEGDCVELAALADTKSRLRNFLEKTGIKPLGVLAFRQRG